MIFYLMFSCLYYAFIALNLRRPGPEFTQL